MSVSEDFEALLEQLEAKYNNRTIPYFKNSLKSASNNLTNLIELLVRKSMIKQDMYNYKDSDNHNSFYLSEQKNFTEIERAKVMYDKIKELIGALDFQSTNALNDISDIDDEFLENSRRILDFIAFHNLNNPTAGIYTRTVNDMINKILSSNDQIMTRIMQDIIKLLTENYRSIQRLTEELTKFCKEKYKISIRLKLYPSLPGSFSPNNFNQNPQGYLAALKDYMQNNPTGIEYNQYWIQEAIRDSININDDEALEAVKSSFLSESEQKRADNKAKSPREALLVIIKNLSLAKDHLDDIYFKIDHNIKITQMQRKTLGEKIADVLKKILNTGTSDEFFQIEYINPITKKIEKDTVNIQDFLISIKKQVALLSQISKPTSPIYLKIKNATEESIFKFFKDTFLNIILIKERLVGIDGEFRLRYSNKLKKKFKSISEPIENLNDILQKITEQRQKYGAMSNAEEFKKNADSH